MKSANKITALNIASTVMLKGIAFFTTPIFTRMLGTEQYGLFSVFFFRVDILVCFVGMGIASSIGTAMYKYKDKYLEYRSSALLLTTVFSLGFVLLANIFINPIGKMLGYDTFLVECLFFIALFHVIVNFAQTTFIYEKKAVHNFVMSVLLSISTVIISLILIPQMKENNRYVGRVLGQAIPYLVIGIALWLILFLRKPAKINKEYALYGLSYGIPVILHTLAHSILSQSDREMMTRMNISNSEIGIYSFYCTLTAVLSVIMNALSNSWSPFYYDGLSEDKGKELNRRCRNVVEIFSVLSIGFMLLSREVGMWVSADDFWGGTDLIPILVISIYFVFLYQFPVSYEFFYKKTKVVAIGTGIAAGVNILLNLYVIPQWGMYGAAASTAFSYALLFLIHYFFVKKVSKGKYHLSFFFFIPGLIAVIISGVCFYAFPNLKILRWGVGCLLGIVEAYRILKRKTIF